MRSAVLPLALFALTPLPALAQQGRSCEPADLAALDGWRGVWIAEGRMTGINGRLDGREGGPPTLAGLRAPLNEHGWARLEADIRSAPQDGWRAAGWGFPLMMSSPAPFRIIVSPKETVITSQYREIRYVPTDGQPQVPKEERWPTIWGTSVGCWEGETLVIETVSVAYASEFNGLAPNLSDDAHFTERLRMIAPDLLENHVTVTDPATLTGPWSETIVYQRHPILERLVHDGDMASGDRVVEVDGRQSTFAPLAEAEKARAADFPAEVSREPAELDRIAGTYVFEGEPGRLVAERRGNRLFALRTPGWPPVAMPFYAEADGAFHSRAFPEMHFRFEIDERGAVTGFVGTDPQGRPVSGRRDGLAGEPYEHFASSDLSSRPD